jgi:hypothetical protein
MSKAVNIDIRWGSLGTIRVPLTDVDAAVRAAGYRLVGERYGTLLDRVRTERNNLQRELTDRREPREERPAWQDHLFKWLRYGSPSDRWPNHYRRAHPVALAAEQAIIEMADALRKHAGPAPDYRSMFAEFSARCQELYEQNVGAGR